MIRSIVIGLPMQISNKAKVQTQHWTSPARLANISGPYQLQLAEINVSTGAVKTCLHKVSNTTLPASTARRQRISRTQPSRSWWRMWYQTLACVSQKPASLRQMHRRMRKTTKAHQYIAGWQEKNTHAYLRHVHQMVLLLQSRLNTHRTRYILCGDAVTASLPLTRQA